MSLFQRIKTPFHDSAGDYPAPFPADSLSVGELLRERREALGYDIEAIGATLRIKPNYLEALEDGRPQDLPGAAYALGFVRAYADLLGLDSDDVLEQYKAEAVDGAARPDLALPVPLDARSLPGGTIILVALILAVCGYGAWYYLSTGERSRPERVAAVPAELQQAVGPVPVAATASGASAAPAELRPGSGLLLPPDPAPSSASATTAPAPVPATQPTPAAASAPPAPPAAPAAKVASSPPAAPAATVASASASTPAAAAPPPDAAKGGGRIEIRAVADCWIQVRSADDQIVFSRILKAGETYKVPRGGLVLRTGNAGALAVAVDGKPAPALGGIGTLRRNVALDPEALLAGTAVHG